MSRSCVPSTDTLLSSFRTEWNFDGSSTGQAPGHDSDVYLRPVAIFKDPFRKGDNILVLCETYNNDGTPNTANHRHHANKVMEAVKSVSTLASSRVSLVRETTLADTPSVSLFAARALVRPRAGVLAPRL
jgi:glutamine synthetase